MKNTYIVLVAMFVGAVAQASNVKPKAALKKPEIFIQAAVLPPVPSKIRGIVSYEIAILPEGGHQITTVFSGGHTQGCFVDKGGNTTES